MYTSNTNRVTGLSGIDTDSMVEKLIYAESTKYFRLQRQSTWKTWQQESYRSVIKSLQDFQNKYFTGSADTNFRYSTAFQNFKSQVLDANGQESNAVTIENATNSGNYEIDVTQVAKKDKYVSNRVEKKMESTKTDTDLANSINKYGSLSMNITFDGTTKEISITDTELAAASGNVAQVMNSKLTAAFGKESDGTSKVSFKSDATGSSFEMAKDGHSLSISEGTLRNDITGANGNVNDVKFDQLSNAPTKYNVTIDGTSYQLDLQFGGTEASARDYAIAFNEALKKAKELDSSGNVKNDADGNPVTKNILNDLGAYVQDVGDKDTDGNNLNTNFIIRFSNDTNSKDITINPLNGTDSNGAAVSSMTLSHRGSISEMGFKAGQSSNINPANTNDTARDALGLTDMTIEINGISIDLDADVNLNTLMAKINDSDAGVKMSYNGVTGRFTMESAEEGAMNEISFGSDANTQQFLQAVGFADSTGTLVTRSSVAQDAVFSIDGVQTSRSSNTVELDGLKFTINKETTAGPITVGAQYDVDSTFEKIKTFVDDYNALIDELNGKVTEKRAKADDYTYYEPLTDQQKKELDEDEIEKWEKKAKTGLLYNDSAVNTILSTMRSSMYQSVTLSDGSKIALYDIGITTSSDYTKKGKLEIDEDKLKEAIKNKGDDIQELFTQTEKGLSDRINGIIDSNIKGRFGTLRQKAGIEGTETATENILSRQIKQLQQQIKDEKKRLIKKENNYYLMFANMESAMTKQDSQLSALTAYMG